MFIVNDIILLEMPKSGSSYLRRFFSLYFGSENVNKIGLHNGIASKEIFNIVSEGKMKVISSIRNPIDWYVSQYTFSGQTKDGIYRWIGLRRNQLDTLGIKSILRNPFILFRDLKDWRKSYENQEIPENFQLWVKLILRSNQHDILKKYGELGNQLGFYSYMFLLIHTYNFNKNYKYLLRGMQISEYYEKFKYPVLIFRLEDDLAKQLITNYSNLGLDKEKVLQTIHKMNEMKGGGMVNKSNRREKEFYHTEESKQMIIKQDFTVTSYFYPEYLK